MAQNSNAFVQTFEKGLQILEYLVEEKTVSVTGVAKRMGIQKSASYRFLNTLRLHGYVDKDQHNSYRLTDRLSKLGKGMVPKREFYNIVAQFLDNLAKKNKENNGICNLGMWNGKEIVYMVQSANDKYMLLTVGSTVPAYCSALGKAVLAYLPDEALENYIQRTEFVTFTESTVNSAERLRADLQAVREKGYALMDDELYPGLIGCEKVDDYTVNVSFTDPIPRLLFNMKDTASCIFYPGSWDTETGYFTEQPVGTGPYIIKDIKEDEYVDITAFDGYWGEPAKTKNIRVRIITDPQARYAALDSEEVMGVLDLGAMPAALGDELLKDDRFAMAVQTSNITHIMLLKGEGTKFSDMRLRQAVSLAIDRQLIVDQLWGGYAMPTQNLINRMCPDWVELPVEYDMDKAKELAREVLGDERLPLDMYTRSLYLDRGPYKEMMEYIQSQLSQIGIDATVNVIDSSTYSEMSKAGELGANFMTHGMSNLNAYHFLDIYMSSEGSYNKSQHLAYSNPHVDELLAEMKTTLDDDRFHELAVELQEIANTELPVIPLFYDTSNLIYNQEQITGYEDFSDHLDLSHLSWVNAQ